MVNFDNLPLSAAIGQTASLMVVATGIILYLL